MTVKRKRQNERARRRGTLYYARSLRTVEDPLAHGGRAFTRNVEYPCKPWSARRDPQSGQLLPFPDGRDRTRVTVGFKDGKKVTVVVLKGVSNETCDKIRDSLKNIDDATGIRPKDNISADWVFGEWRQHQIDFGKDAVAAFRRFARHQRIHVTVRAMKFPHPSQAPTESYRGRVSGRKHPRKAIKPGRGWLRMAVAASQYEILEGTLSKWAKKGIVTSRTRRFRGKREVYVLRSDVRRESDRLNAKAELKKLRESTRQVDGTTNLAKKILQG